MSPLIPPASDPEPAALYPDLALAIEYVAIGELRGYPRNTRTHSKRQIEQIAESIRAFGFLSPVVADAAGELIAGHGRVAAAKRLKLATVPVVRIEHLDDAQKRALRIADNRLAELAGWDRDLLAIEFKDLLELDLKLDLSFDVAITGFAPAEIDRLVDDGGTPARDEDDDVHEPDRDLPAISRPGDLWILGDHRLICGDAREPSIHAALLAGERAAMGIHDAPYNVSVTQHVSRSGRHSEFAMASGEMTEAAFTTFLADFLKQAAAVSRPGAIHFAFMDWRHMGEILGAGRAAGLELKNLVVWNKGSGAMGSLLRSQHELVFMFKEPSGPHLNNVQLGKFGRTRTNVWDFPGSPSLKKELELHPRPKPVALVAEAIRDVSDRNDIVLDCFSGSGTTIIAAAKTGRRGYAIELDPHYVDVAVRRWETWSGGTARHAESGLSFVEEAVRRRSQALPPPLPSASAAGRRSRHEEDELCPGGRRRTAPPTMRLAAASPPRSISSSPASPAIPAGARRACPTSRP
jgi:DNA modification methylase